MAFLTALGFALCLLVVLALIESIDLVFDGIDFAIWVTTFLISVSCGLILLIQTIKEMI